MELEECKTVEELMSAFGDCDISGLMLEDALRRAMELGAERMREAAAQYVISHKVMLLDSGPRVFKATKVKRNATQYGYMDGIRSINIKDVVEG